MDRIRRQVVQAHQKDSQGNQQDRRSDRMPLEALGDSDEEQHRGQNGGVKYVVVTLLVGCLSLFEGFASLSLKLICFLRQAELVLGHHEGSWWCIRVVEGIGCQPGLECGPELW